MASYDQFIIPTSYNQKTLANEISVKAEQVRADKTATEALKAETETLKSDTEAIKAAAESARQSAIDDTNAIKQAAIDDTNAIKAAAESARDGAIAAKNAAESAKSDAETAAGNAESAALSAQASAESAALSALSLEAYATTSLTYAELKSLRDGGNLVAGCQYRITDYITTTAQAETRADGRQYDIIVIADTADTLNERARACIHEGDTHFAESDLAAWQVWYSLDNDSRRFAWADATNGKGVVYRLIDEFGNDCPYDFKCIQFKRYKITGKTDSKKPDDLLNTYSGARSVSGGNSGSLYPSGYTISTSDTAWRYTFDLNGADYSLGAKNGSTISKYFCHGNEISPYYYKGRESATGTNYRQILNNVVFLNSNFSSYNFKNRLTGNEIHSNTFGNNCYSNTFGNSCDYNTFGNSCDYNTFGNSCHYNTFGNNCYYNTFGNNCYSNTFGNSCDSNTFGNNCDYNTFGNSCHSNTFGNNCDYNTFGNSCDYNTFGNSCHSNTFGNNCHYNTFGNSCDSNTFEGNPKRMRLDCHLEFDSDDSSDCRLVAVNDGNTAVTITGKYWYGEYEDADNVSLNSNINVTVQPGHRTTLFSYDDNDFDDGYSVWNVSYMCCGYKVINSGNHD